MRFFLANFEVDTKLKKSRAIQPIQDEFKKELIESKIEFFDSGFFSDYDLIWKEIESSDILVAFIDEYWTCSTWKAAELFYGSGGSPEKENKYIEKPLKCFVYDISKNSNVTFLENRGLIVPFNGSLQDIINKMKLKKF